ncbi:peptidase M24 [Piedraia hortae CBS 480.64]|uniref:Probable Xaa-Pro aminopeptidase P n=1 Tax=Piedraia hortae CBS 480.64 TaxID=1314780 RepID=A0A6A7C376_9PEZI|nr:peptidase M24 [Piedraia hortae CBS 480.64]
MEAVDTTARLKGLRSLMKEHKIDVYVVPSEDAHSSEYIAPTDARREFICGFTGSAGTAVITHDKAVLATDGRYFNQASKQLDHNWELLKQGLQDVPTWQEWTIDRAADGGVVGVDPTTISSAQAKRLSESIQKKGGKELVAIAQNLVDQVWGKDKPSRPNEPVKVLDQEYAGKPFQEKIEDLRKGLDKKKAKGFVVSMLDEVAWLFNLRGNDIPYNPVFFSYALVTPTATTLFVDESKLQGNVREHLENVQLKPYNDIFDHLSAMSKDDAPSKEKYLVSNRASWALQRALGGKDKVDEVRSSIGDAKAVKNKTELEGMRRCHVRDGAALVEYFAWLEHSLIEEKQTLDEVQGADKLEEIRRKQDKFIGLSFDTISSTGPNAAVIHYKPEPGNCSKIDPAKIYLCDSGAQYLDGTTDTTRTLHFGEPSDKEREAYTLVLKGHIALDQAVFPKGTTGFALDALARQHLWASGLDYRHGTGHGVGSYLNVHEGPIGIGARVAYAEVPLSVGNVISNEPGYYEDGNFGIRIENIFMVKETETKYKFGDKPYLAFEHVTMVPCCRKLVDLSMLTKPEREWIDAYHEEILNKLRPFFSKDERTMKWLERECKPLE